MDKEWEVEFTLEGRIFLVCESKEEAEKLANEYLSGLCQDLYPDCYSTSYEIDNVYSYSEDEEGAEE